MERDDAQWGSDVRVSMPLPPTNRVGVVMSGFAFTEGGMAHDIDEATYARLSVPDFAPEQGVEESVFEDADLDRPFAQEEVF
jgi:hypothetical protein